MCKYQIVMSWNDGSERGVFECQASDIETASINAYEHYFNAGFDDVVLERIYLLVWEN